MTLDSTRQFIYSLWWVWRKVQQFSYFQHSFLKMVFYQIKKYMKYKFKNAENSHKYLNTHSVKKLCEIMWIVARHLRDVNADIVKL